MSTQVQFRRGTTTQNNAFTGAAGEISVDTDLKTIRLHDGTTAGGGSTMLNNTSAQTALNKTFSTGSVWQGTAVGMQYGGTGSSLTPVAGAIPFSTANGLGLTASGTSGQILVSGGVNAPTWVPTSSISAGSSTLAATATNIAGGSAGQLVIQADTGLSTFITAGASGTFLRSAGAGYAPTWATADVTIGSTVIDLGSSTTSLAGLNILAATGTSHWTLPVGTTAQRPASPAAGMVRYNTSQTTFEGYSAGAWSSLGGVTSVDKFTYIVAETSPTASNGDLDFYAENSAGNAAQQVGQWNRNHLRDYTGTLLGTQTTQNVFNTVATTVNAFGASTATTVGATTGTHTIRNATVTLANATSLNINGASPAITTTSTTASVFNSNVTTLNIGGAATTVSIGAATGTLTLNNANTVITGNLTVNGTTTTINSTVTSVDDIEFELGSVNSPTDITANGGGIRLKGTTDKTINWSSLGWTSSEDFNLVSGKIYEIAGTEVLSASTVFNSQTTASLAPSATTLTIGGTSGTATIRNSTVAITNAATIGSTLGVTGVATLSNNTSVGGTLTVTGNATFNGTINRNPVITLAGDLSGSVTLTNLGNATLTATIVADSVALGTDTTGNYVAAGAVSGNGLSGSASSEGATFTVTSNATNANTANTIVFRDGSGNFSAGTITATLSGNVTGNVSGTAGSISGFNNPTSGNTGNTIVYRDGSGNFSAGTVTATLAGTANNIRDFTINQSVGTGNNPTFAGVVISAGSALVSGHGGWTGDQNKIQWHSSHLYFQNMEGGRLAVFRRSNGAEPCVIANDGTITAAAVQTSSDIKLKENVQTITNASHIINNLRGVTFDWKATKKKSYGFIAQELEQTLPELVVETPDNTLDPEGETTKSVDYDKIVSVLVEGWKEQQAQIQELRAEVDTLKARLGE